METLQCNSGATDFRHQADPVPPPCADGVEMSNGPAVAGRTGSR
jgi:hypothetical protein